MATMDTTMADRDQLATALVQGVRNEGVSHTEVPVSLTDPAGRVSLWKVTIERVGKLEFKGE
jgi:hypothetical protein